MKRLVTYLALLTFSNVALADTITATTDKTMSKKERAFARGYPVNSYCGNDPESWVRGRADFDTASGNLHLEIQLETDATHAGPKGQLLVTLYDKDGNALAVATSKVVGTGGEEARKGGDAHVPLDSEGDGDARRAVRASRGRKDPQPMQRQSRSDIQYPSR